jgi:plastocyanin
MNTSKLRRALTVVGFLALSGLAGACSSGAASESDGGRRDSPIRVLIQGVGFAPSFLEIEAGTEVQWVNKDPVDHTVTSGKQREQGIPGVENDVPAQPDGTFNAELPEAGDTFRFTFDEPGIYSYYCDVHAGMTGEIKVE